MKPDQIYLKLKDLADRLNIIVSEKKLSTESLKVKSGLCKIKGQLVMILDKQLPVYKKNAILAACLSDMPHEDIFMIPAVRDFLARHRNPVLTEGPASIKPQVDAAQSLKKT